MKFYNREKELKTLRKLEEASKDSSKMAVLMGRRRIGKTTLLRKAYPHCLYFFIARKSEKLLCEEFIHLIEDHLDHKILGNFDRFPPLFEYLMEHSRSQPMTLVVDEFQEFFSINPSVYSEVQKIWDEKKSHSKMNLILCGSIYAMMKKIFEDQKEPLFGRADIRMILKPFPVNTLEEILKDHHAQYSSEDVLSLYVLTGGVAKYVECLIDAGAYSHDEMLDEFFDDHSIFIDEGKNILIEEFGKDHTVYFSILSCIASSKTSRTEIESILERNVGGHLDRLENEYSIIEKVRPTFSKEGGRVLKYEISDNFLKFWFRFLYKNRSAIEIENFQYVKSVVRRDYSVYSGPLLEKYFREKLKLSGRYSMIGHYWEKGNKNEIDIVALNEAEKKMLIAEVKRNKEKIDLKALAAKAQKLILKNPKYSVDFKAFSLEDMLSNPN